MTFEGTRFAQVEFNMEPNSFQNQLVETLAIQHRIVTFLLDEVADESWMKKVERSKSPCGHFCHIHNVRLMWLNSAEPELLLGLEKLEGTESKSVVRDSLLASAVAMEKMLANALESGRVKGFKPHPVAFLGYIISHETFHRAQVELSLRQLGTPIHDKVSYGQWEWGTR